ncbi:MAG: RHS repeat domain-containing protein [Opitutaceae bacterium]
MNGRIYDPLLGRFLSPDPMVEDAYDLQTFNRYSYVHNNPLTFIDPDGNSKAKPIGWVVNLLKNAVAPRAVRREMTHKALANAMAAGGKNEREQCHCRSPTTRWRQRGSSKSV